LSKISASSKKLVSISHVKISGKSLPQIQSEPLQVKFFKCFCSKYLWILYKQNVLFTSCFRWL